MERIKSKWFRLVFKVKGVLRIPQDVFPIELFEEMKAVGKRCIEADRQEAERCKQT